MKETTDEESITTDFTLGQPVTDADKTTCKQCVPANDAITTLEKKTDEHLSPAESKTRVEDLNKT